MARADSRSWLRFAAAWLLPLLLLAAPAWAAGPPPSQGGRPPAPPPEEEAEKEPPLDPAREALPPGENLIAPPPPGWVLSFSDRDDDRAVYEYLPADQNPDDPAALMAITVLYDARGAPPAAVLDRLRREFEQDCEGAAAEPAQPRAVSGQAGLRQVLYCGRLRRGGGKGQVVLRQVVAGRDAAYAIERVWRGPGFKGMAAPAAARQEIGAWQAELDRIALCDTRDPARPCTR